MPLSFFVASILWGTWFQHATVANQDLCRHLKFTTPVDGYALEGHVIKNISLSVGMRGSCRGRCTIDSKCLSINVGPPIKEHVLCQLSDSDHMLHPEDLKPREGFTYRGTEGTFHYNSNLWINQEPFNLTDGETGFDTKETKLPTYWNTPFTKICLGMNIGQQINFIVINKHANSLYSLIADGQYRNTSLGRDTWKTLIGSEASLQLNCNKEGFNAGCTSLARIGIIGNEGPNCSGCDSKIGFGTGGGNDNSNTCGNVASWSPDNGNKNIKAMGYILVK